MADPEVGCNYVYLSLLLVLSWASVTWAQTFQKPSIDTPTTMTEGTQYTISCSCISTGENVSLALKRSDQSNVISRSTQCKVVAGDTILCNSIYEFTARREDNGVQVICTAVQTGNPESKSDTTILDVLAKPRSSVSNTVIKATIGTEVTLNCETDANPPATHFNWSFDAVALNETGFSLILTPTNTSFGEYTCNATNTIGTSDPIVFILEEKPLAKPRSNISNYVISASIGMTVNLTCATNANPPATDHEWSFGGVTLNATESSLEITLTDDSLFGVYTCVAVNRVGKSDPIVLILQERNLYKPEPATGNIALFIGGCAGGFVVFTVLAAGVIFICRNRRRCCVTNHVDSAVKGNPRELKTRVSYTVPGTGNLFAVIQKRKPGVKPKNRKGHSVKI